MEGEGKVRRGRGECNKVEREKERESWWEDVMLEIIAIVTSSCKTQEQQVRPGFP